MYSLVRTYMYVVHIRIRIRNSPYAVLHTKVQKYKTNQRTDDEAESTRPLYVWL